MADMQQNRATMGLKPTSSFRSKTTTAVSQQNAKHGSWLASTGLSQSAGGGR